MPDASSIVEFGILVPIMPCAELVMRLFPRLTSSTICLIARSRLVRTGVEGGATCQPRGLKQMSRIPDPIHEAVLHPNGVIDWLFRASQAYPTIEI